MHVFDSASEMLESPAMRAVAVGAPISQRAYWCERVAQAGKQPLCAIPLGPCGTGVKDAVEKIRSMGQGLRLVDRSDCGEIAEAMGTGVQHCGRVVFYTLDVDVDPSELQEGDDAGVLMRAAVGYLGRLSPLQGELDTVWAETRSLLWGRMGEDVAVAYLRSVDGCEGTIRVGALGRRTETRLCVYGRRDCVEYRDGPDLEEAAWKAAYAELVPGAVADRALPLTWRQLRAGVELACWIGRAARARRAVFRRELNKEGT